MTIDIEQLINEIDEDGSGEIEYDEFMSLLSSGQDNSAWIIFCRTPGNWQKQNMYLYSQ